MLAITNHTFPKDAEAVLSSLGHRTLRLPPHPRLQEPVSSHPDMLLFFAPNAVFCTKSYYEIATNELEEISLTYGYPIRFIEGEYGTEYPCDVLLNALPLGEHLFCNTKTVAKELLELNYIPCHVNQGYTKCSALPLGSKALITSDTSIAESAKKCGVNVLQICKGHISLTGYNYGFIGGCANFPPRNEMNTVFFSGDLSEHPDAERIEYFCQINGFDIIYLSQNCLCDIGTIFMI